MHARRFFSALGIGLALVFAFDYMTVAATGQSLVLGHVNKADQATVVKRTTPGTTLDLRSKPGSPPLAVNRQTRIDNLNADLVDGIHGSELARRSTVTAYNPPGCPNLFNVDTSYQKLADVATITKKHDDTLLRVELFTRYFAENLTGYGVIFELRVDNAPTQASARALLLSHYVSEQRAIPMAAVFDQLSAGTHTVSVWVRTSTGTARNAKYDPSCWGNFGANQLLVTEY